MAPARIICIAGLAGMAYCHARDLGAKTDEHVYYMAALFCCNVAASVGLIPLVAVADRVSRPIARGTWMTAAALAAATIAGFLWSRTIGLPQMRDHIGQWETLGVASLACETLVLLVAVPSLVQLRRDPLSAGTTARRVRTLAAR